MKPLPFNFQRRSSLEEVCVVYITINWAVHFRKRSKRFTRFCFQTWRLLYMVWPFLIVRGLYYELLSTWMDRCNITEDRNTTWERTLHETKPWLHFWWECLFHTHLQDESRRGTEYNWADSIPRVVAKPVRHISGFHIQTND